MLSGGCEGCTPQSAPPFIFRGEGGEGALQKEEEVQGAVQGVVQGAAVQCKLSK